MEDRSEPPSQAAMARSGRGPEQTSVESKWKWGDVLPPQVVGHPSKIPKLDRARARIRRRFLVAMGRRRTVCQSLVQTTHSKGSGLAHVWDANPEGEINKSSRQTVRGNVRSLSYLMLDRCPTSC
jgi:hypothetical protein